MKWLHYFYHFSKTLAPNRFRRPHDAVLLFARFPCSSAAAVVSTGSSNGQHVFMAQYLVESCGFDQEKAADVSKQLRLIKSRQQPDSVLSYLRSYGLDDKTVKNIIVLFPRCLLLDVEKSLAPKFRAFQDLGLSRSDVARLIQHPEQDPTQPRDSTRMWNHWPEALLYLEASSEDCDAEN